MPQFVPDQCTFQDGPGLGQWDNAHFREHQQFVEVLAAQTPAVLLPNYDFLQFLTSGSARASIMQSHQKAHDQLGGILGITATDFGDYDLSKQDDFYNFLGSHATTHAQIRQALGIV